MNGIKMNVLMIFGFTLLLIMQPGMGNVLPHFPFDLLIAAEAAAGKATNDTATTGTGTTTGITTTTTGITTTLNPMTTSSIAKEQQITNGTTAAATTAKVTTAPHKDRGYMDSLFDFENSVKRKHQKHRSHGAAPTKAPLEGSIVAQPLMYYNNGPPRMQAARVDLELSYKPSSELLALAKEIDANIGAPSKRHRPKVMPTLPPLIEMLNRPQQHPDMAPIMEFLHGVVDLVINSSSSNSKEAKDSKPIGYFNKTVSPDGKHLVKEFGLMAPNMVIKGFQQEHNYDAKKTSEQDTFEALEEFLGPDFRPMKMPQKFEQQQQQQQQHHQQQYLKHQQQLKQKQKQKQFHHRVPPLGAQYELLNTGIDQALHQNYEMINRLLQDLEEEDELLQKKFIPTPVEELIVSCPIHHEYHADRYGGIIEEDVVDVDECEAVKVLD